MKYKCIKIEPSDEIRKSWLKIESMEKNCVDFHQLDQCDICESTMDSWTMKNLDYEKDKTTYPFYVRRICISCGEEEWDYLDEHMNTWRMKTK